MALGGRLVLLLRTLCSVVQAGKEAAWLCEHLPFHSLLCLSHICTPQPCAQEGEEGCLEAQPTFISIPSHQLSTQIERLRPE